MIVAMADRRLSSVDNLRTLMVAWVIGAHAFAGYAVVGGWPYDEVNEVTLTPGAEVVLTVVVGQSGLFVIGAFFFVAGLFTPQSLRRKGRQGFLRDRLVRLGLPWVVSMLFLWPLSLWVAYRAAGHDVTPWWVFTNRRPLLDSGALWFALVLLVFSVGYAMWPPRVRWWDRRPTIGYLLLVAAGVAAGSFLVRLWFPARSGQPGDLHLWQWPQCAGMFALGIAVSRCGWARRVPDRQYRVGGVVAVSTVVLLPLLAVRLGLANAVDGVGPFLGGWHWQALLAAAVEGVLVVFGSVFLVGLAQRSWTWTGPLATGCARVAFPAFVLQGPVLVLLAVALRPLAVPAEVKAALLVVGAIVACFSLPSLLARRAKVSTADGHSSGYRAAGDRRPGHDNKNELPPAAWRTRQSPERDGYLRRQRDA